MIEALTQFDGINAQSRFFRNIAKRSITATAPSQQSYKRGQSGSLTSFSTGELGSTEAVQNNGPNRLPGAQYPQTNAVELTQETRLKWGHIFL